MFSAFFSLISDGYFSCLHFVRFSCLHFVPLLLLNIEHSHQRSHGVNDIPICLCSFKTAVS